MLAEYPSSVKAFSTKATNDVVQADHVNALQAEVAAIETALLTALQHDLKFTDATYDIGKSGATRPRDLFLSRNAVVGGTLGVTGAATLSSTLDVTGAMSLAALLTLTNGQIAFPATQNASSGANTLDDYEEGSWTPVIGGSGGTSGQSYSARSGRYIKIGRLVIVAARILLSTKGTITGNVQIQGLPFTATNTSGGVAVGGLLVQYFGAMNTNWVSLTAEVSDNSTVATVYGTATAGATVANLTTSDIANATDLRLFGAYLAAN